MKSLTDHEPEPKKNNLPAVWSIIIQEMQARDDMGRAKYGTPLQPFNGRSPLVDAWQEILDLLVYLRQELYEREWEKEQLKKALALLAGQKHLDEDDIALIVDFLNQILSRRYASGVE